jgi:L-fuconolactonase
MTIPPTWPVIDAHHHLWDPGRGEYPWMTREFAPLRREYAPEHLLPELAAHHVDATVVVQVRADVSETRDLLELAMRHGFIAGVVGWVDLTSTRVARQLAELRAGPGGHRLAGIRHNVQDEPDPRWLLRADVQRGLDAVAEAGLAFDLEVTPRELAVAARVAIGHPQLRFVLDHLGKPPVAAGGSGQWRRGFADIAACANVWCKLSGLVTEADWGAWTTADLAPYLSEAADRFGASRLLFGSDWPVCELAASYGQVLNAVRQVLRDRDLPQASRIFGPNAIEVYRLATDRPASRRALTEVSPADQPRRQE